MHLLGWVPIHDTHQYMVVLTKFFFVVGIFGVWIFWVVTAKLSNNAFVNCENSEVPHLCVCDSHSGLRSITKSTLCPRDKFF